MKKTIQLTGKELDFLINLCEKTGCNYRVGIRQLEDMDAERELIDAFRDSEKIVSNVLTLFQGVRYDCLKQTTEVEN